MAKQKIAKPSFRETVAITTIDLDDVGLFFNAQIVGPMNFYGLRQADYGEGFKMPTMPELVPLVHASWENQDYESAKNILKTLRHPGNRVGQGLVGNTVSHYLQEGMFAEDNPLMENGRLVTPTYKELESKLGSHEEKGVVFSDDRFVRFTPYGFKKEAQSPLNLSINTGIIALVGGEENAERLAKVSEHRKGDSYLWAFNYVNSPLTQVVCLKTVNTVNAAIDADDTGDFSGRYSLGVCEKDTEGVVPEK